MRARFEARQGQTRTWVASFTQTLAISGIGRPVISEGTIRFRAPDQLRIDFSRPEGEFVLALGDRLFVRKAGKPVAEKRLRKDSAGRPILSLLGLLSGKPTEDESKFDVAVSRDGASYLIVLSRKRNARSNLPRRITNTIAASTLDIRQTLVELPNGGTISYAFGPGTRNQSIPARFFEVPRER